MEAKDVKVGMKVVPHAKTAGANNWNQFLSGDDAPIRCCTNYFKQYGFLNVVKRDGETALSCGKSNGHGAFFNASDFDPAEICVGDVVRTQDGTEKTVAETCGIPPVRLMHRMAGERPWYFADTLDLVRKAKPAEPEKPADRRPTVGDWVEIVENNADHGMIDCAPGIGIGSVGQIKQIWNGFPDISFNGSKNWFVYHWDCVKLTTAPITTPPDQKPNLPKCVNCTAHGTPLICHICVGPTRATEPATVLRSDADAAVRRAYIDGQRKIANTVVRVDYNPSAETLAKFWEAD